jgi:hypothetical protein
MFKLKLFDWGDGYFVFFDGEYLGKDDQLDLIELMTYAAQAGGYDVIEAPEDWDGTFPSYLEEKK